MKLDQKIQFCTPACLISSVKFARGARGRADLTTKAQNEMDWTFTGNSTREIGEYYFPKVEVVEEFANCRPEPTSIARFTQNFGLLVQNRDTDGSFSFSAADFISRQRDFRLAWHNILARSPRHLTTGEHLLQQRIAVKNGVFALRNGELVFVANTLYELLLLQLLLSRDRGTLRICARLDCDQMRFFISDHPRTKYCSEKCAEWAQGIWKGRWWAERGAEWSKVRKTEQKSKNRTIRSKKGSK